MNILCEDIKSIIYKYLHNLKLNEVLQQLENKLKYNVVLSELQFELYYDDHALFAESNCHWDYNPNFVGTFHYGYVRSYF